MIPCDDAQIRLDFCHRDYLPYRELIGDLMPPTVLDGAMERYWVDDGRLVDRGEQAREPAIHDHYCVDSLERPSLLAWVHGVPREPGCGWRGSCRAGATKHSGRGFANSLPSALPPRTKLSSVACPRSSALQTGARPVGTPSPQRTSGREQTIRCGSSRRPTGRSGGVSSRGTWMTRWSAAETAADRSCGISSSCAWECRLSTTRPRRTARSLGS